VAATPDWSEVYSRAASTFTKNPTLPADVFLIEKKIDAFRELEPDWDAEGSLPVSEETISLAKQLVRRIARNAKEAGIPWNNPAVAPGGDGGIHLSWEMHGRWGVLIIRPGRKDVECVTKEAGLGPHRQIVSVDSAIKLALWALENMI
jgi:hypothetical protein